MEWGENEKKEKKNDSFIEDSYYIVCIMIKRRIKEVIG